MRTMMLRCARLVAAGLIAWAPPSHAQQATPPSTQAAPEPSENWINPRYGASGATVPGTVKGGPTYAGPLMTKWGRAVTPANAWTSYPRPQMKRDAWQNLNGEWDYAITKATAAQPKRMDGKILVPFAVESKLSGVQRAVLQDDRLWYRRRFTIPTAWAGKRVLLHFGAVDHAATIWVNGGLVGSHSGGSDPFSFDVSDFLKPDGNEIVVAVTDPTSTGAQPRGKQTLEPRGIWYTAVTGIWQTVWLEPVPDLHIAEVRTTPDIDAGTLAVAVSLNRAGLADDAVLLTARSKGKVVATALIRGNRRAVMPIPDAHLWNPDDPFLYDLDAELVKVALPAGKRPTSLTHDEAAMYAGLKPSGPARDKVSGYFGMRKVSVGPDAKGRRVILLNNRPLFQNGVLDQGWWPESLLTPPSEDAARSDMEFLKKAGFNMLRKHIKVEPAQYYHDADRLGMLIWQDMPSGANADQTVNRTSDVEALFSSQDATQYQLESTRIIDALRSHPSIVMWVTGNEGWGQYDARLVATMVHAMDPSRLVNASSGWLDSAGTMSSVYDLHSYEGVPQVPRIGDGRAVVLGEYGGIVSPEPGHVWFPGRVMRIYQRAEDKADYLARYRRKFAEIIRQYREDGLSAAVYTQTTDVEGELNGLLTYDRAVVKIPPATLAALARQLDVR